MRKFLVMTLAMSALVIAATACTGDDDDDGADDDDDDDGATMYSFAVSGSGFTGNYVGKIALARVLDGTTVLFCGSSAAVAAGGTWSIGPIADVLMDGESYDVEVIVNRNAAVAYNAGTDGRIAWTTATVSSNLSSTVTAASGTNDTVTWTSGSSCPGS